MTRHLDSLLAALVPTGQRARTRVWALLDAARDDSIYPFVRDSGLDWFCLYGGRPGQELRDVAPYVIELKPDSEATRQLIDRGWGNSWGIFVTVQEPGLLRPHLVRLLKVQDESGRRLHFRFYDPRVMRIFLPTCDVGQLMELFGPIGSYRMEGEDGDSIVEFRADGGRLTERHTPL